LPTTTLHLVRHAEAQGESHDHDPELSEHGRQQANALGARLRYFSYDALLHSPKRRAAETAATMARHVAGVTPEASALVDDRTPVPDDWSTMPARYHALLRTVPADEADVGGRFLQAAVTELGRVGEVDRTVIVVTHAFVIGWFVREVLDAPWWRWIGLNADNASLTTVRFADDRPAQLLAFNDLGHLGDLDR